MKLIALGTDHLICIFTTCGFITLSPSSWTILSLLILTYTHGKDSSSIILYYVWLTRKSTHIHLYFYYCLGLALGKCIYDFCPIAFFKLLKENNNVSISQKTHKKKNLTTYILENNKNNAQRLFFKFQLYNNNRLNYSRIWNRKRIYDIEKIQAMDIKFRNIKHVLPLAERLYKWVEFYLLLYQWFTLWYLICVFILPFCIYSGCELWLWKIQNYYFMSVERNILET